MPTPIPIPPDLPSSLRSEVPRSPATAGPNSEDTHSPAHAGETPISFSAARIPRGKRDRWTPYKGARARSTVFTPELVTEILETIERFGFTEAEAAVHCHVSTSTLDRWKREDPELEDFLVEARLEFASNQIHTISSFTRRDGQLDPQGAKWLLERSNPERWGRPSARRQNSAPRSEVSRGPAHAGGTAPAGAPKPNTPEYWDYVEEEPWPRNLSTCTFTPGRQKFYAIYHLVSAYYRDQPKFRDQPSVDPESEQGKRGWESFFSTQETYFSLPKEQRIPYLHALFERQYEKVLTPEERAAADLAARGPCASPSQDPSPFSSPPSPAAPASCPSCPSCSNPSPPPSFPAANENTTPTQNEQNLAEMPIATSAAPTTASAPQTAAPPVSPAAQAAAPKTPPPQPPTPARRPIFRVKRRCISPDNPAWPQYQADLQREAMEQKLAEMEELQAQGKPADSTHEAALARYHELARQEQERLNRENEAFFNRPDDQDEELVTDCF